MTGPRTTHWAESLSAGNNHAAVTICVPKERWDALLANAKQCLTWASQESGRTLKLAPDVCQVLLSLIDGYESEAPQ